MKLLLAEDDPLNRDMLARRLRRRGFDVIEAADGASALELARTTPQLDAVLLDLDMPLLNGWSVLRTLRDSGLRLPVLILTAHSLKEERQQADALEVAGYLTKPLDFDQLLERLEQLRTD